MTKKQLITIYVVIVFMMVWGLDLIAYLKLGRSIAPSKVFNVFHLSQVIYVTVTLLLTRWLFKKLFLAKKNGLLVPGILSIMLFFIVMRYLLEEVVFFALFGYHNYAKGVSLLFYFLDNIYYSLVYLVLGFLIFLLDNQVTTQKMQARLLEQTREAELQFLRSQINPHFLFNTLNNIYSLVHERSPKAPEAMLKLAELMRYLLYEQKEKVPLSTEWNYVQNFIALQRLRYPYDLPIEIELEGPIDQYEIIPHLLVCFVENAFKHGDFKDPSIPLKISIQCKGPVFSLSMQNKIGHQYKDETGGVGLRNIRRRLDLLYPSKYALDIKQEKNIYSSLLQLSV